MLIKRKMAISSEFNSSMKFHSALLFLIQPQSWLIFQTIFDNLAGNFSFQNLCITLIEALNCLFGLVFSSPEHEVLMVSYCDQSLSVVRALSTFCFKQPLLQNGLTDIEIILQEGSLSDPLPKLLKPFRSIEQDGHQS